MNSSDRPQRIQLRRTKGWRKPEGAVVVARPSVWGNPWTLGDTADLGLSMERRRQTAVERFAAEWEVCLVSDNDIHERLDVDPATPALDLVRDRLGGKDLCCWCPLDQPFHAKDQPQFGYPDGRRFIAEQEDRDDDRVRLDLDTISRTNRERCKRWHDADSEPWTGADWSNAMCGEAGETANVVKKLRRHETGTSPQGDPGETDLRVALADEIADTLLYLLLLADHYSVDVPAAVVSKFNRVSERQGFPERLSLRAPDPVRLESL